MIDEKKFSKLQAMSDDELDQVVGGGTEVGGKVIEALPNAIFQVELENGQKVLTHVSGKLRTNFIRILPGDKVTVDLFSNDPTRGRITYRSK